MIAFVCFGLSWFISWWIYCRSNWAVGLIMVKVKSDWYAVNMWGRVETNLDTSLTSALYRGERSVFASASSRLHCMEMNCQFLLQLLHVCTVCRRMVSFCSSLFTFALYGDEWSVFASASSHLHCMEMNGQFLLQPLHVCTVCRRMVGFCFGIFTFALHGDIVVRFCFSVCLSFLTFAHVGDKQSLLASAT
jgi:hypothetical protein